jgi:hypothetical protein
MASTGVPDAAAGTDAMFGGADSMSTGRNPILFNEIEILAARMWKTVGSLPTLSDQTVARL